MIHVVVDSQNNAHVMLRKLKRKIMSRQLWFENIRQELIAHEAATKEFTHLQNVVASEEPIFSNEAHKRALALINALRRVSEDKCVELRQQLYNFERKEETMTPTETEPEVPEVPEEETPEEGDDD
jgi:hypothetical protein